MYSLTEEETKVCYTQALMQCLFQAKITDSPQAIYVVAQPGAGKSGVIAREANILNDKNEKYVELSADKIATYHKYYADVVKLLPNDCYKITREFTKPALESLNKEMEKINTNIISETTFSKVEKLKSEFSRKKEHGYNMQVDLLAVDKYESLISCQERDLALVKKGLQPRGVYRGNHDRVYNNMLDNVEEIYAKGYISRVNVYRRGEEENNPEVIASIGENANFLDIRKKIEEERKRQREELFANKKEYITRINKTKEEMQKYMQNPVLLDNAITDLNNLEEEFIKEVKEYELQREEYTR